MWVLLHELAQHGALLVMRVLLHEHGAALLLLTPLILSSLA